MMASAMAACDNQCSGHGTCGKNGVCECYDNWGLGLSHDSGDCSDRICPYDFAWVDTPDVYGRFHKYAECSNQGLCARDTGLCQCFPGYAGVACQRTECPNSCSGHGRCEYIQDLGYAATAFDFADSTSDKMRFYKETSATTGTYYDGAANQDNYVRATNDNNYDGLQLDMMGGKMPDDFFDTEPWNVFPYHHWDKFKSTACVCDPTWGDYDCSKRMCPYGTDAMDHRNNMVRAARYQVQSIELFANEPYVEGGPRETWATGANPKTGASDLIDSQAAGTPRTFALTFKSKLNETFTTRPIVMVAQHVGFHGMITSIKSALEALPNRVIDKVDVAGDTNGVDLVHINITFSGDHVQGPQYLLAVEAAKCGDGCTPKVSGLELRNQWETILEVQNSDFNSYECGRRGKCDYSSGVCQCFEGYTGIACNTITALV